MIGILCRTARKLDLDSLTELHQMSFDQALAKGDLLLAGLKDIVAVYGLEVDDFLDSFEATTLSENGNEAVVAMSYEFLGTRHTTQAEMEKIGGRWFRKEAPKEERASGAARSETDSGCQRNSGRTAW